MSDVVVSVVESNTAVTVTEQDVAVDVTENNVVVSVSTAGIQGVPGANNDPTYVTVRNATGATLAKGTIVYISGANGNNVQVSKAIATGDSTSARTIGWLAASIPNNGSGLCMVEGYLEGLNTQGFTAGAQLYLSGTVAGGFTQTKPQAPIHLVYVGVVTKVSAGDGHVFVKVQNGYELGELHDVLIVSPTNNQVLAYDSATQLWKNATNTPDGVTSITATAPLTGGTITSTGSIGLDQTALSITKSQVSDFTSGTVTSASTAQQAGTAVYAVNSGTAVYATTSGTAVFANTSGTAVSISGDITKSQVSDFTSGTVASAGTAQQSGTAVFANTSGTATYATTSGTAVTISGDITKSQVSDFTSGTVASASTAQQSGTAVFANTSGTATFATTSGTAVYSTNSGTAVFATNASTAVTISGSITQGQVTNLTTDLAGKANLAGGNAFTGAQTVTASTATQVPLTLVAASGQTANLLSTAGGARIPAAGNYFIAPGITSTFVADFNAGNATTTPVTIAGVSGQTANLLRLAVAGTDQATISASGILSANGAYISQVFAGSGISGGTLGRLNIAPFSATQVGAVLRGAAGQSVDLLQMQDSAGNIYMSATAFGGLTSNLNGAYPARWSVGAGSPSVIGLIVRGAASQTADLLQVQNSTPANLFSISSAGLITAKVVANAGNQSRGLLLSNTSDTWQSGLYLRSDASGFPRLSLLAPTGALGEAVSIDSAAKVGIGNSAPVAQLDVYSQAAARVGQVIRGAASQTANLLEIQNSAASVLLSVTSAGNLNAPGQVRVGTTSGLGQLAVVSTNAATIGAVVQGAVSQTANLQTWQDSSSNVLARVNASGIILGASLRTINQTAQIKEENAGAALSLTKMTSQAGNDGAGIGRLYFRDGTNAGTLKLVVRAGATGAETTILDNIPT
jgi:hypothetical protein